MATLRTLNIDLRAGTARLASDFQKANSIVGKFQRDAHDSFSKITSSVFSLRTAIGALVGAAGLGALVKNSLASADALAKSADKIGVTTKALAGLQYAADLSGVDALDANLKTMVKNLGDFANGTGRARVQLEALGFSQNSLINMSADQQFLAIADALNNVENATKRTNAAVKIFGDNSILNLTAEGSAGLRAMAKEAESLGIAMSRVDAAKIEMANDAFTKAQYAIKGAGNTIAVELAPYLKAAADEFVKLVIANNGFRDEIIRGFEIAVKTVAFFADVVRGLQVVWKIAEVAAVGFVAGTLTVLDELNKAAAAVFNAMIDAVAKPLIAIFDALGNVSAAAKSMAEDLRNAFKFQASPQLSRWAEGMRGALGDTRDELSELVMTPMPSAGVEQFFANVRAQAEEGAKAIAEARTAMLGGGDDGEGDPLKTSIESAEAYGQRMYELAREAYPAATQSAEEYAVAIRDQIAASMQSVEQIRESLLSEEESLSAAYATRAEIIGNALQQEIVSEEQARGTLLALEADYQARMIALKSNGAIRMNKINTASLADQARATASFFSNTFQAAATHNRALFEIFKVAKIAEGILNMRSAISGAYAVGAKIGGPVLGGAFAAAAGVAQLANLAAIQATSFGGGGGGGVSGGGAVPTFPANPVTALPEPATREQDLRTAPARVINITLQGDDDAPLSRAWVRDRLIPELAEALGDGATLQVT